MAILPNATLPGNSLNGSQSFGQQLGQALTGSLKGSVGLSDASGRLNVADTYKYSTKSLTPLPKFFYPDAAADWRVRISLAPNSNYFYKDGNNSLLRPLMQEIIGAGGGSDSGVLSSGRAIFGGNSAGKRVGVVFPYTPQVQIQHLANYSAQKLTHNNYTQYFYDNSEVQAITITGDFTVQNVNEGQYLLACIYFFRSITKMFFGNDSLAGNPPPLVYLNGYGQYYLPNVPCVITSFSHTMPSDIDYMDIPEPGIPAFNPQFQNARLNSTRLPTTSSISVTLQPVYSRYSQSNTFNLNDFAAGRLINSNDAYPGSDATRFGTPPGTGRGNFGGFI